MNNDEEISSIILKNNLLYDDYYIDGKQYRVYDIPYGYYRISYVKTSEDRDGYDHVHAYLIKTRDFTKEEIKEVKINDLLKEIGDKERLIEYRKERIDAYFEDIKLYRKSIEELNEKIRKLNEK